MSEKLGPGFREISPHNRRKRRQGNSFLGLKQTRGFVRKYDNGMTVRQLNSAVAVCIHDVQAMQAVLGRALCGAWMTKKRRESLREGGGELVHALYAAAEND